jgi:hypothetical protein
MACMANRSQFALLTCALAATLLAPHRLAAQSFPLDSTKGLQPQSVLITPVTYQGRKAIKVISTPEKDAEVAAQKSGPSGGIVILPGTTFHNGTIEIDVSGQPRAGAPGDARGFVGVGFRLTPDAAKYESVYIRPTNGRADDQIRRNHSTQYASVPEYEWFRLRTESPGKYESYVDLEPGVWTHLKIEVRGVTMSFYVNGASQPTLLVNDLKLGDTTGPVALWIGVGTEAYFANLRITE